MNMPYKKMHSKTYLNKIECRSLSLAFLKLSDFFNRINENTFYYVHRKGTQK